VAQGSFSFSDTNSAELPTASIDAADEIITYEDANGAALSLTAAQTAALKGAFTISAASGNAATGVVDWDYSIRNRMLNFLGAGQSVSLTVPLIVTDQGGSSATEEVSMLIDGGPLAVADSASVRAGGLGREPINGFLCEGFLIHPRDEPLRPDRLRMARDRAAAAKQAAGRSPGR
jgi:hypothetical protein